MALVSSNQRRRSEISVSYSTQNSAWLKTSQEWRHHVSINCVNSVRYVVFTSCCWIGTRRSAGALVRSFKAWLPQLSSSRSVKVGDQAASTRSKRSSVADSWPTDEWGGDTNSEAAPLVADEWTSNCAPWCTQSTPVQLMLRCITIVWSFVSSLINWVEFEFTEQCTVSHSVTEWLELPETNKRVCSPSS